MRNKRAMSVILSSVGLLMLVWLLFACVAPPGASEVTAREPAARELAGETCQTFTSVDVPKAIPDSGAEVPVGSFTTSKLRAPMPGYITDLTVTFTIDHEYPGDLQIVLCGPRNLNCQLVYGDLTSDAGEYTLAFSSDPTHTDFNDIYDGPPYTGSYPALDDGEPLGLAKFRNAAAAGEWRLGLLDEGGGDVGTLTAWSLELCTTPIKGTPRPSATPLPAYAPTPLYGCTKDQFVAGDVASGDPCDCSNPLFNELPNSDADSGVSGENTKTYWLCAPGCYRYAWGFSVVADLYVTNSAQSTNNYLDIGSGIQCGMWGGQDPGMAIATTEPNGCIGGDCTGLGCRTLACSQVGTQHIDEFISSGESFSPYVGAGNIGGCLPLSAYEWSYAVTWGACWHATPTPTYTPKPTATRPCPTALPQGLGWWMW
jgi:subtilisin-like proprotein convertase family protein